MAFRCGMGGDPAASAERPARSVDGRRVISGIMHMLRSGGRWKDCPTAYGPYTTIYNRWNRWSRQGVWERIFYALTGSTVCSPGRSTPPTSRPIARRRAQKGGLSSRHWHLARWTHDQNPRAERRRRSACRLRAHARQCPRPSRRQGAARHTLPQPQAARRPRLRCCKSA